MKSIVTLTGPTCSGKTTLESFMASNGYGKVISHTTRDMRPNEDDCVDYYFVDHEYFDKHAIEFVEQIEFDGNRYGLHCRELERLDALGYQNIVVVAEPNGVIQIQEWCIRAQITVASFFLHINPVTRYERFLERLPVLDPKAVKTNAKRLVSMTEEHRWFTDFNVPWLDLDCNGKSTADLFSYLESTLRKLA